MEKKKDFVVAVVVYVVCMLVSIMMRVHMDRATNHLTRIISGLDKEEDKYEFDNTVYNRNNYTYRRF